MPTTCLGVADHSSPGPTHHTVSLFPNCCRKENSTLQSHRLKLGDLRLYSQCSSHCPLQLSPMRRLLLPPPQLKLLSGPAGAARVSLRAKFRPILGLLGDLGPSERNVDTGQGGVVRAGKEKPGLEVQRRPGVLLGRVGRPSRRRVLKLGLQGQGI